MGEVHADYDKALVDGPIPVLRSGRTNVNTSAAKLSELLNAIDLGACSC